MNEANLETLLTQHLNILDHSTSRTSSNRGVNNAALLNVDDTPAGRANSGSRGQSRVGIGKGDSSKVGKRHQRAALLEILYDPLGVLLAQGRARADGLGDGLPSGDVLDDGCPALGGRGSDCDGDGVSSRDGDPGEIVCVVGVPLIPGC